MEFSSHFSLYFFCLIDIDASPNPGEFYYGFLWESILLNVGCIRPGIANWWSPADVT